MNEYDPNLVTAVVGQLVCELRLLQRDSSSSLSLSSPLNTQIDADSKQNGEDLAQHIDTQYDANSKQYREHSHSIVEESYVPRARGGISFTFSQAAPCLVQREITTSEFGFTQNEEPGARNLGRDELCACRVLTGISKLALDASVEFAQQHTDQSQSLLPDMESLEADCEAVKQWRTLLPNELDLSCCRGGRTPSSNGSASEKQGHRSAASGSTLQTPSSDSQSVPQRHASEDKDSRPEVLWLAAEARSLRWKNASLLRQLEQGKSKQTANFSVAPIQEFSSPKCAPIDSLGKPGCALHSAKGPRKPKSEQLRSASPTIPRSISPTSRSDAVRSTSQVKVRKEVSRKEVARHASSQCSSMERPTFLRKEIPRQFPSRASDIPKRATRLGLATPAPRPRSPVAMRAQHDPKSAALGAPRSSSPVPRARSPVAVRARHDLQIASSVTKSCNTPALRQCPFHAVLRKPAT